MRIGELARATGTTARALRHYEQAGLLTSRRAANGYRFYADAERTVMRVRNIRELLDVGLTLDDVRAFGPCLDGDVLAAVPSDEGLRIARDRPAVLDARIAAQVAARNRLAAALGEATLGEATPGRAACGDAAPGHAAYGDAAPDSAAGHAGADSGVLAGPRAL